MNVKRMMISMTAVVGLVGASATLAPEVARNFGRSFESGRIEALRQELASTPRGAFEGRIRNVAKVLQPSVVQVMPMRLVRTFSDFGAPQVRQSGVGSGVIVSKKGYILTNNHVVRGASKVRVKLFDGRSLEARVVGTDPATDLAVLDIDADGIVPARLGKSKKLQVGDWVIAAGSPFGLEQSVSAGIVSAFGRSQVGVANYEDFIQTDAAVNPGNSGGPLVNLDGEVIGINTAIASRTGAYNGISFAIPSHIATRVLEQIIENGRVERGWLGFYVQDRADGGRGALVVDLIDRGPAERAGILSGDVIVAIEGEKVPDSRDLIFRVADLSVRSNAKITLERAGKKIDLVARIAARPPEKNSRSRRR